MNDQENSLSKAKNTSSATLQLSQLWPFLLKGKWVVLLLVSIFALIGLYDGFTTPREYESLGKILPELQSKGGGGLGRFASLAGLAGINLENLGSTEAVRPDLYPNVLQSTPFMLYIMNQQVYDKDTKQQVTLAEFMKRNGKRNETTLGRLRKYLLSFLNTSSAPAASGSGGSTTGPQLLALSLEQEEMMKDLLKRIECLMDKKTGIITIRVTMRDPIVSASIAQKSIDYVTKYVISYRVEKIQKDVDFYEKSMILAREKKNKAELAFARFNDQNRSPFFQTPQILQKKLQDEYIVSKSFYDQLVTQLEQTRMRLRDETPVIKVLEPPRVPVRKSKPSRLVILLSYMLIGGLIGFFIHAYRQRQVFFSTVWIQQ
jgi:uncharacterized protein involved in exopolysaccharide biosynthesis